MLQIRNPNRTSQRPHAGPKGHWFFGLLKERQSDPLNLFQRLERNFEPVTQVRMLYRKVVCITDLEIIHEVLLKSSREFKKGFGYHVMTPLLGNGLVTSEGDFWRRQRRLAQPAFHRKQLESWVELMRSEATAEIQSWGPAKRINVRDPATAITMRIVGKALFGKDVSSDTQTVMQSLSYLIEWANHRIVSSIPLPTWAPLPSFRKANEHVENLNRLVFQMISERRNAANSQNQDLLQMLMDIRDEDTREQMTDTQLRDEVMTLFTAGHETTAVSLSWTFWLLATHPEIQTKVAEEIRNLQSHQFNNFMSLSLLSRVIDESMRLYPPVWLIAREATRPTSVHGYSFVPSDILAIPISAIHRSSKHWQDPEAFNPDRFLPENSVNRSSSAYMPFSSGPRNCIGQQFAKMELLIVLATFLERYEVRSCNETRAIPEPVVTLRPKDGIVLEFHERLTSTP